MDRVHQLYGGEIEIKFKDSNHSYWTTFGSPPKKDGTPKLRRLAGVTTPLGMIDKSKALLPWAVGLTLDYIRDHIDELSENPDKILEKARKEADRKKEEAADIGSAIHAWIEAHIEGRSPDMPTDERVVRGVVNFLDYVAEHKIEFISSEQIVYSKKHDFVGTADVIAKVDGKLCLIDIKTSNGIYGEAKAQTAAYRAAWEEEHGKKMHGRWIWRISKETEDEYHERMQKKGRDSYADFQAFEARFLDGEKTRQKRDFDVFLASQVIYRWKNQEWKDQY